MKNLSLLAIAVILPLFAFNQKFNSSDNIIIGKTWYDLQTWRANQNRIFMFDDGTIGAVWNMSFDYLWNQDMGVGYNFNDGDEWTNASPEKSITSIWSIFPSYTAYGENGEICFSQGNQD